MRAKLLIVSKAFWPVVGGVEETVRDSAEVSAAEFDVTVLAVGEAREYHDSIRDGYRVVKVPRFAKVFSTPLSMQLHREFVRLAAEADIVHLHSPYPPAEISLASSNVAGKTVMTYHFDVVRQRIVNPLYNPLLRSVMGRVDRIICSNPNLAQSSELVRPHIRKVTIVSPGIDSERLALTPRENELVAQTRSHHNRPVALFVGRLVYYKGIESLVRAAQYADIDVVIAGSGPLEANLRALAESIGVGSRVNFLQYQDWDSLKIHYHACDVFVLPSVARSEAFGLVLLEAMAAAKPLVTTELGTGTSWVNQNGITGLVVPPRDARALAEAIERITRNPETRARFGMNAATRVKQEFSRQRFAEGYLGVYRRLLADGRQAREDTVPPATPS